MSLSPIKEEAIRGLYEVKDFQMSGIPVNSLSVRVEDEHGFKQLSFESIPALNKCLVITSCFAFL